MQKVTKVFPRVFRVELCAVLIITYWSTIEEEAVVALVRTVRVCCWAWIADAGFENYSFARQRLVDTVDAYALEKFVGEF